jgi:hypothetical protein
MNAVDTLLPDPLRQSALALHALAAQDRAWVLAALPEGQRAALQPLLAELEEIGIPRDADLLRAVQPPAARQRSTGDLEALARLLRREPPGVAAGFLAAEAWPWRREVLQRVGARAAEPGSATTGPALRRALVEAVQEEWATACRADPPPRSRWQGWRQRFTTRSER